MASSKTSSIARIHLKKHAYLMIKFKHAKEAFNLN